MNVKTTTTQIEITQMHFYYSYLKLQKIIDKEQNCIANV